jgi:glycosyltransferase involved in cell wall biosynthesis
MIDTPLVSVITPAYNRANYLVETMESVLTQDYSNIEYIVLDDGSKDNTKEILDNYSGRIKWSSHSNIGETRTVNKGLELAKGEIIAIVNSDDPLLPSAISTAVAFMQAHPEIVVAYPDWVKIGPNSEIIEQVQVPEYDYNYMVRRHHCIVGPGAFIRRRAIKLIGFRDPEFKYVADFDYWLRLGMYGDFARIPHILATFRVHSDSASVFNKGTEMADEHIRLIKKIYSLPNLPLSSKKLKAESFSWAHRVAAKMCNPKSWAVSEHRLLAIYYYPGTLMELFLRKLRNSQL